MSPVGYSIQMAGDLPVVTAPEEITESNADQLRITLLRAAARGAGMIVLDLTGTRRCEPAAVRVLERARLRALSDHGELRLTGASADVLAELAELGPGWRVPCYASLAEAVAPSRAVPVTSRHEPPASTTPAMRDGGLRRSRCRLGRA
jgi:anti-anti-sigma regulatory factor